MDRKTTLAALAVGLGTYLALIGGLSSVTQPPQVYSLGAMATLLLAVVALILGLMTRRRAVGVLAYLLGAIVCFWLSDDYRMGLAWGSLALTLSSLPASWVYGLG